MLKPHRLDDQNFIDIVNRSRRLIQKYAADWTNENASDPGITILEMLSWLKDNMQYYMDQSDLISQKAYMDLLGISPLSGQPAQMIATVTFTDSAEDDYLSGRIRQTQIIPKGFPVWAGDTRFELSSSAQVQVSTIVSVYSSDEDFRGSITDLIGAFDNNAAAYPFGPTPGKGQCLYIGFDDLRPGLLSFFIDLEDDPIGFRNPYDYNEISFADGVWEMALLNKKGVLSWHAVEEIIDETHGFMNDGIVTLKIDKGTYIQKCQLLKGEKALVWLRYRLINAYYDRPPVIENLIMNAIRLKQEQTAVACHKIHAHVDEESLGQGSLDIQIDDYVPEGADMILEILTPSGYKAIDKSNYACHRNNNGSMRLVLGENHDSVDITNLRLITGDPTLGGIRSFDVTGRPYDTIDTTYSNILFNDFSVEINEDYHQDKWRPWQCVHHLYASKSDDRHIVLMPDSGQIAFGNNEHGMLPDSKNRALRIVNAKFSKKDMGNGQYKKLYVDEVMSSTYQFTPVSKAEGGHARESDEEAFNRFHKEVSKLSRMVSKEHIEEIVKTTPGLAIRDVSVIVGDNSSKPGRIIALPKSESINPELPEIYVDFINKRIQQTRLITEQWFVTGPDYIGLKVKLEIIKDPAVHLDPSRVRDLVLGFIEPQTGKLFGRRLSAGRLKRSLESISGIIRVSRLSLRTDKGSYRRADGDVQLPLSAIAHLSDIDLQILDDQGW